MLGRAETLDPTYTYASISIITDWYQMTRSKVYRGGGYVFFVLIAVGLATPNARAQQFPCALTTALTFSASDEATDNDGGLTLRGYAWLCYRGTLVQATLIRFDEASRTGWAEGGVDIRINGHSVRAERIEFLTQLNEALARRRSKT